MIYLDTSCLLKLLREEPESGAVRDAVDAESEVIISALTELETEVQLKAAYEGGEIRLAQLRQLQARLTAMKNLDPFYFRHLPAAVFQTALKQIHRSEAAHCRTLDRLHLAAMHELNLKRLITLDEMQRKAGEAIGYTVLWPTKP
jgi:predicted nucleic acid-binding protein